MKTFIERISDNKVKLTIEVDLETWQKALDQAFEKKVQEIKVDGFRPGKLPKQTFLKRFGYESLYEEALQVVFSETYPKAVHEHDVKIVNQPSIDLDINHLSHDKGFSYTAEVDVLPIVHLGEYLGLKVKTLSKEVTDEDIENEIDQILMKKVENVIKETAAENGDTVVIDFEGFIDNVPFEGGKGENYPLELGSNSFIPGFEEQLIGVLPGEEKEISVTFPTNYHESLAGKDATFKIKVHEVKTKIKPAWDDELVKDLEIENVNTVVEHRAHIKEELTETKAKAYEEHLEKSLIDVIVDQTEVDIPTCMIDEASVELKENIKKQANQYQIPFELYLQYMGLTEETLEQETRKVASLRIKQDLILNEIIVDAKIKATDEEVEDEYLEIAKNYEMTSEKVKELLPHDRVSYQVERKHAIKLLKDNAILD